ncbi:MAG: hypothetical protein PUG90_05980 [Clostridia bacterium]|nr:hypothetical protein [Clostridia bacterium]MDY4083821.1 hypothetical protein [Eubacteriales bacterium]
MAKFTELQKTFAQILVDLGLKNEEVATVMTLLQEESQMEKMVDFIEANPQAKANQVIEQAAKISQT